MQCWQKVLFVDATLSERSKSKESKTSINLWTELINWGFMP